MTFGAYALIGFVVLLLGALGLATRRARKAGEDSLFAKQAREAKKGKQRVSDSQNRVNSMSDDDVSKRLHDNWSRD